LATASLAAPVSYDELGRLYGSDIMQAVRRSMPWASLQDREDVVQYILQQFLPYDPLPGSTEKPRTGVIGQYRPDVTGRNGRPVSFKAFILAKAALYCRYKRQSLATHYSREMAIGDAAVGDGSSSWIEQVADPGGEFAWLGDEEAVEVLRRQLADAPPAPGQPGLVALFDELADRVDQGLSLNIGTVGKTLGLPRADAEGYLARLRDELRGITSLRPGEKLIDLGPARLPARRVQAAADALKTAAGNQVVKYWRLAGLGELAGLGTQWYLVPAKRELELFPQLRGTRGGHYEGGHGSPVKRGLIHWLERQVTGEPDPTPEQISARVPAQVHYDQLEAALWRIPGSEAAKVDEVLELARKVFG
jgi:hypothetical protein